MEVLVTGGDTDLGRTVAESFCDAGHRLVIAGARRDDLEVAAKELDVDAIVFDNTDPASLDRKIDDTRRRDRYARGDWRLVEHEPPQASGQNGCFERAQGTVGMTQ